MRFLASPQSFPYAQSLPPPPPSHTPNHLPTPTSHLSLAASLPGWHAGVENHLLCWCGCARGGWDRRAEEESCGSSSMVSGRA